jgi:DNA polymerase-3 subunit chi
MQVDFYHLAAAPIERVLPRIAEKVLADGGRLLVVGTDEALLGRLDIALWSYAADSFLPHGRAGLEGEDAQPVLLSSEPRAANGARYVALVDGTWRQEALTFDRAFHFFDDTSLGEARTTWKALADHVGVERRFWKQDEAGRWARQA